ncbi:MAG: hypothetical protein HETSPECPRED_007496 [Heterodermia speciosa]|uniref:PLD phosphodiesterase domain-containing protein n=1 Tax=Heterodermia speciosa TaxID=116794 RepID=A0A8H3FTW7_9LECA|nr:MAG: hypothetical protein HETSPECPRED_007496 [Heterodermia speciosa]
MEALRPSGSSATNWVDKLLTPDGSYENRFHFWGKEPATLSTTAIVEDFTTGTGEAVFTDAIVPLILSAQSEVILVTCFWACSPSLTKLSAALIELSRRSLAEGLPRIRVRLCFSSRSLLQKLLHSTNCGGEKYPPSAWASKLGLPPPEQLQGLELQVKSLFFLPFSVLHPKFVIVDRRVALLPSCNVSWETWLECCLQISGPVVSKLRRFWTETWEEDNPAQSSELEEEWEETRPSSLVLTSLLPSPQHQNPHFRPLFLKATPPPLTPLNVYLFHNLKAAKTSIDITTPNLTCKPVLSALIDALERGVDVNIFTCRRMMMVEQLVTAGTITEFCVWRLVRRYKTLSRRIDHTHVSASPKKASGTTRDVEQGQRAIGRLNIQYFNATAERPEAKCHIKCTVIDESIVILGSGNMDRASWYTSQELGIALEGKGIARRIMQDLSSAKEGLFDHCYYAG